MYDIAAIGESLIDFAPAGKNEAGMELFSRNPGGAPANVLAMCARLGGRTAFIGKVGNDGFGRFLRKTMEDAGIFTGGLLGDPEIPTTLAFVQLDERGDRSFSFYRHPGADIMLRADELPQGILRDCRVFHFGSVSLTDEPCRTATLEAAGIAKSAGAVVSCDPNYRAPLWRSAGAAAAEIRAALPLADIVKVSDEELTLITGEREPAAGARALLGFGASAALVTMGPGGAYFMTESASGAVPAYDVETADTTGAGDAFMGALLWRLAGKTAKELRAMPAAEWEEDVRFANAAGSLTTRHKGAIPAMPSGAEIEECVRRFPVLRV